MMRDAVPSRHLGSRRRPLSGSEGRADSFVALDGETEIGAVETGVDAGSWRWSLRHPHLGPTSTPLAVGTMPTRKEAAQALLACWQAWYRTGDEGGEP